MIFVCLFNLLLLVKHSSPHPAREREATDFAKDFLINYGFMFPEADDYFYRTALIRYQKQSGLAVTGLLDAETLLEMQRPRCSSDHINQRGRWKRFGQYRRADSKDGIAKWELGPDNSLSLRWFISRYTDKLSKHQVTEVARKCFASWERRSRILSMPSVKLHFEEAFSEAQADINILFAEGQHGDNHPFDGRADTNNILAHTFYPKYSTPRYSGDIHLDDAEDWTVSENSYYGTKLENVLLHEIGHSLGLTHSFRKNAVMYPVYKHQTLKRVDFDIDDKCALNWIYIGPSNTCLYVWVMSEVLAREIDGYNPGVDKYYTGVENNSEYKYSAYHSSKKELSVITDADAVDKESILKARLRRTPVPRCIEDNGVREHIDRLLRIRLNVNATAAEDFADLSCRFLGGLFEVANSNFLQPSNILDQEVFDGNKLNEEKRRRRRQVETNNFEADRVFDWEFYERFFQFYAF